MSISEDYNQWAAIYDSNLNKTRDLDAIATREMLSRFPFKKVLELGCGTGKNTQYLLEKATVITGIDFSEKMLQKASEKIQDKRVTFIKSDIKNPWPVSTNFFDLITCSLTLEHLPDLEPVFNKAYVSLKKGGRFFISELHPIKQYLGSKARFDMEGNSIELSVFTHHLSDYLKAAKQHHFKIIKIEEWFDKDLQEIPRLISFIFEK